MSNQIKSALNKIKSELPEEVVLVAVSKTKPVEMLQTAYDAGQRIFGENRAEEVSHKAPLLPKDVQWHFIGHLQGKKVKTIIEHTALIHSVDSEKLLVEINKRAESIGKTQNVLLQFHIAKEDSKYGLNLPQAEDLLKRTESLKNVSITGVMGMATFTEDQDQIKSEFQSLKGIFDKIKTTYFLDDTAFKTISMGMSGDYKLAISHGSNMIRVGSKIFGSRG